MVSWVFERAHNFVLFEHFTGHQEQFKPDDGIDNEALIVWMCNMTTDFISLIPKIAYKVETISSCRILCSMPKKLSKNSI